MQTVRTTKKNHFIEFQCFRLMNKIETYSVDEDGLMKEKKTLCNLL